jgi:iron complex transport system permease protein
MYQKLAIIGPVALLVAAQVAISGVVGWVGLIVPHLSRALVGPNHTRLSPTSALAGGLFLFAMDDIARSIGSAEIPIGLLTAGLDTPFFSLLFYRHISKGWANDRDPARDWKNRWPPIICSVVLGHWRRLIGRA